MRVKLSDDWDEDGWVQVPRGIARDARLSWKARGLVLFLASHKPGFVLNREFLIQAAPDGEGGLKSGLAELRDAHYLEVVRERDEHGRLGNAVYVLHREPQNPSSEPTGGFSTSRKIHLVENPPGGKSSTKREQFKERAVESRDFAPDGAATAPEQAEGRQDDGQPTSAPVTYSAAFEAAWTAYGRKGAKRAAWAEWQRAIKRAPVDTITAAIPAYLQARPESTYRKDFERWLKGDVWESADCAGATPAGPPTEQAIREWINDRWRAADTKSVADRAGLNFYYPNPPEGQGPPGAAWHKQARQAWIKENAELAYRKIAARSGL